MAQLEALEEAESEELSADQAAIHQRVRRGPVGRFIASYPRAVWLLTIGNTILWLGRGMVMPFIFIYFNEVAGLPASVVGGGIAVSAIVSSVFVVMGAPQIDRRGAQPVLLFALGGLAIMTLIYPWAITIPSYLLVSVIYYTFDQIYWPAVNSAIVPLSDRNRVAEALALLRCSYIAGIGLGSLLGGVLVSGGGFARYRITYTLSVGVIVVAMGVIWRGVPAVKTVVREHGKDIGSWRDMLSDRTYVLMLCLFFFVVMGYSQLQVNIPAFLHKEANIDEGQIGVLFTIKMVIVLAIQIPIASRINRGNLGKLLSVSCSLFAGGLFAVVLTPSAGLIAAALVFCLFTLGEVLFAPVSSLVPVRLSPAHMRGRYFAAQSVVWGGGWGLGAFSAGVALDSSHPVLLWPILAVMMIGATFWSWRFGREPRLAS